MGRDPSSGLAGGRQAWGALAGRPEVEYLVPQQDAGLRRDRSGWKAGNGIEPPE
jgi:hypothetical protein